MDLYFAGSSTPEVEEFIKKNKLCRLQSQLNDRSNIRKYLECNFQGKLFIDSGAYTAYTRQVELNVEEYIEYINSNIDNITLFAQVDKIPGEHGKEKTIEQIKEAPELSWDNYLYMREKIKQPDKLLPIFHRREDFKYLKQMLEWKDEKGNHIPYIGIAATTDSSTKEKEEWFHKVFEIIKKSSNPNVKTHAFGMTSLRLLEIFPFTSADSTSWLMTAINGNIRTPFGIFSVSEKQETTKNAIINQPDEAVNKLENYLLNIGLTLEGVRNKPSDRLIANLIYLQNWVENYEYKPIKIKKRRLI